MRTLAFVIVCLISWPALAFDLTTGAMRCTTWLQERGKLQSWINPHTQHVEMPSGSLIGGAYLIGFIEGYDWACPVKKARGSGLDTEAVLVRADQLCKSKGGETPLLLVALELVKQLDPQHNEVCSH
jgi:hypothetical protein